jgi:hypothetical protein
LRNRQVSSFRRVCRLPLCVAVLILLAACGGEDGSPAYSASEVKAAFVAEGLPLHEFRGELRSNRGFWIIIFASPEDAQARKDNFYGDDGALGQPEPIDSVANVVVYSTRQLDEPIRDGIESALSRLSRALSEP